MTLPGLGSGPGRRNLAHTSRVKAIVEDLVAASGAEAADTTVLVTELECSEPGCPPVETVIALLTADENVQYKIHKPLAEVDATDVQAVLGGMPPQHPSSVR
ncbi:MAG: hypothetical protein AAFY28_15620 [Actinomycetota bacterium]